MSASEPNKPASASELSKPVSASEPNKPVTAEESAARPTLRVVRGDATPEEIAVLVALLGARSDGAADAPDAPKPVSAWASPRRLIRTPLAQGPGAWAASAWR